MIAKRVHAKYRSISDLKLNACSVRLFFSRRGSQGDAHGLATLPKVGRRLALPLIMGMRSPVCSKNGQMKLKKTSEVIWRNAALGKERQGSGTLHT